MPARMQKQTLARQLLARLLDEPALVCAIQHLEAPLLAKLVHHVGLEDAGELVALATPRQLLELFDEDLWRHEPDGDEESFDADRFVLWLEVMLDHSVPLTMRQVAAMDEDLLTLALCRQLLVIDLDEIARRMSLRRDFEAVEDALLDKALESSLSQEFEQYAVIARNHRTWEALRTLLVELDAAEPALCERLLLRCCAISGEYIDDNGGLYDVLTSDEMVAVDVAAAREERRARHGYVAQSDAVSFLAAARLEPLASLLTSRGVDPITRAYFRDAGVRPLSRSKPAPTMDLLTILRDVDIIADAPLLDMLMAGEDAPPCLPIHSALRLLGARHSAAFPTRLDELAYLANTLMAGCSSPGRELRPFEAGEAALATCNLGAETLLLAEEQAFGVEQVAALMESESMVKLFRIAWRVVYDEIVSAAAQTVCRLLDDDPRPAHARAALALRRALGAGKPWRAWPLHDAVPRRLGERDEHALGELMHELPRVPQGTEATTAAFTWIARRAQLDEARAYLAALGKRGRARRRA